MSHNDGKGVTVGWDVRGKSGKLFYYPSRRTAHGRVVKRYPGGGKRAEPGAAEAEQQSQTRGAPRREVEAGAHGRS